MVMFLRQTLRGGARGQLSAATLALPLASVSTGDLTVDLSRASVKVRDELVTLTAKEWVVLRALVARPDRIHSKEALASVLYGFDDEIGSNTVEVFISHLRQKIGRNCVLTLRGQGYRLTGDCT